MLKQKDRAGSRSRISDPTDGAPLMTDTQAVHTPPDPETDPRGDLSIRTLAMPSDTNHNGDIFVGWRLSQMDIGVGIFASHSAKWRTGTAPSEAINFGHPRV